MDLQIVMRTAPRAGPSYLARTIAGLRAQGIPAERLHVCPTRPMTVPEGVTVHQPEAAVSATRNMARALRAAPECEWVVHLEDDVLVCRDFCGSVTRWIAAHVTEAWRLVTFFALRRHVGKARTSVATYQVADFQCAQAFALRWADAQACAQWIEDHAATWRTGPGFRPWAHQRGADRMVGAWHQDAYPEQPDVLASVPCLVEHVGIVSSLRGMGAFRPAKAAVFTGEAYA